MRLTRLEAHDFAQHAALDVDLSTVSEAAIVGENGSGKSKLMDAALWCLYGRATRGTTDALIRDSRDAMWVRTTWATEGRTVKVTRTRSIETKAGESSLGLEIDGARMTKHTIAETQAVIEELVGLTRDQLLAGPWMPQGRSDTLMQLRPADRTALVTTLFGLERMVPWHERAKEWLAGVERELAVADDRRRRLEDQLTTEPGLRQQQQETTATLALAQEALSVTDAEIERLRAEAQELHTAAVRAAQLSQTMKDYQLALDGVEGGLRAATSALEQQERVAATEEAVPREPSTDIRPLEANVQREREASTTAARLAGEIRAQRKALTDAEVHLERQGHLCNVCPYREETPDIEAIQTALAASERELETAKATATELAGAQELLSAAWSEHQAYAVARERWQEARRQREEAAARVPPLRAEVDRLTSEVKRLGDEIAKANAERLRLVQSEDRARDIAAQLTEASRTRLARESHLREAQRRADQVSSALAAIDTAREQMELLDRSTEGLYRRLEGLKIVVRMFHRNGLPTAILESGLPLIESRANELLAQMPGNSTVRFRTQRLTKSGTWSDELDIEVEDGGQVREYDVMSGAERFRIDLALRIAIGTVLAHRSSRKFETLWVDEGFSAQSKTAVDAVLGAVAAVVGEFGLTLVVTHQEEVADRFPVKIEVRRPDRGLAEVVVA